MDTRASLAKMGEEHFCPVMALWVLAFDKIKLYSKAKQKAKRAAYIPPHSASSTLWAVYKLITQATYLSLIHI